MSDPVALSELKEIHEYVRHALSIYVTWFTFFLLFLFGAMAWSLKASINAKGKFATPAPFYFTLGLFSVQLIFGIWLTTEICVDLQSADNRSLELLVLLDKVEPLEEGYTPNRPIPPSLHLAFYLMDLVLISQLAFWLIVGVYVFLHRDKKITSQAIDG